MKLIIYGVILLLAVFNGLTSAVNPSNDAFKAIAQAAADAAKKKLISSRPATDLLIAEPYGISRIGVDEPIRQMTLRTMFIGGIDYHIGSDRVYWSEVSTGRVYSKALDRSSRVAYEIETVVEKSPLEWRPRAIALDCVHDKLYVLDSRGKKVHAFALDGSEERVVFDRYLGNPMDLAIDPYEGVMFIADGSKVLRVNLDGTSPKSIVHHRRYYIKSVALDLEHQRVYWSDETYHRIKSANYDGTEYSVVLKNEPGKPYSLLGPANLAFHDSYLYLYDDVYRRISRMRIEPSTGKADLAKFKVVYNNVNVGSMKVIHPEHE